MTSMTLKDEKLRHLTSTNFDKKSYFIIIDLRSRLRKSQTNFLFKIQNVINRHYFSRQVIFRRVQQFSSKFVKNDSSCLLTSFDIQHSSSFHILQMTKFDAFFIKLRHLT